MEAVLANLELQIFIVQQQAESLALETQEPFTNPEHHTNLELHINPAHLINLTNLDHSKAEILALSQAKAT
jgi:hypothetical protein